MYCIFIISIFLSSIVRPLSIIFKNCLHSRSFPNNWKKSNVVPIHKKVTSNFYKTNSLFLYCQYVVKFLRELIFNSIFEYIEKNSLLCPNQSGFCQFDSCENQLVSIVHDIYANFDQHPALKMRANFLDILEAFDKVWHEGLLFKLEHMRISGNLLSLLKSFLSDRLQQVVLNGQCSNWSSVLAGVLQVSILGPLIFLIYINDLSGNLQSTVKLFADDRLFSTVYQPNISASQRESDLKMNFNPDLSKQA